nr:unnamed protein product [Callosobruchus chinensis]
MVSKTMSRNRFEIILRTLHFSDNNQGKSQDGKTQTGLGERVVMYLCEGLLGEGRTLYTDNFYTSITLAQTLLNRNTHLVGTLRKNRKNLPKSVSTKTLALGTTYREESQEGIVEQKWKPKPKKEVLMLSTKHNLEMQEIIRKRKRVALEDQPGPSKKAKTTDTEKKNMKPKSVIDYNSGKAGIDKSDQMSSYNTALRKGMKWYRKVAWELITGTAVVNAHVIYKEATNKKVPITKFREQVCRPLIFQSNIEEEPPIKEKVHLLLSAEKRKNCSKCYISLKKNLSRDEARKKVRRVKTYCSGCPGKPVMCKECHIKIHSK